MSEAIKMKLYIEAAPVQKRVSILTLLQAKSQHEIRSYKEAVTFTRIGAAHYAPSTSTVTTTKTQAR